MAQAIVRLRATMWGELLAEFLGTFVLIAFGDGVVAMAVAALNQSGRGTEIFAASGDWLLIAWGWALAVAFGVYVAGGVSGAHINPAVTLALAVKRNFPWVKVAPYMAAPGAGGVRRGRAHLPGLPRRHRQLRGGQAHHPGGARRGGRLDAHLQHLRHLPRPLLRVEHDRSADRPDRGHGVPAHVRARPDRR